MNIGGSHTTPIFERKLICPNTPKPPNLIISKFPGETLSVLYLTKLIGGLMGEGWNKPTKVPSIIHASS